jgi:hypothetical protein
MQIELPGEKPWQALLRNRKRFLFFFAISYDPKSTPGIAGGAKS